MSGADLEAAAAAAAADPGNYDAHVAWISAADAAGDLDAVREARRTMSQRFPLTPALWLAWITTEAEVGASGKEVLHLAQAGLDDYVTAPLAQQVVRALFRAADEGSVTTAERDQQVSRVLDIAGWDVSHAGDVFQAAVDAYTSRGIAEHRDQLIALMHSQLARPHEALANALHSYQQMYRQLESGAADLPAATLAAYEAATQALMRRHPLERAVRAADTYADSVAAWQRYAAYEREHGTQDMVNAVYERAVSACCLSLDLWRDYCANTTRISSPELRFRRALRNLPWSGELAASCLRVAAEPPMVAQVAEAVAGVRDDPSLPVIAYVERCFTVPAEQIEDTRASIDAVTKLVPEMAQVAVHRVRAHWEVFVAQSLSHARQCSEYVLSAWGASPSVWYERIALEYAAAGAIGVPAEDVMRDVFRRAVNRVHGDPSDLEYQWICWERQRAVHLRSLDAVHAAHVSIARRTASRAARSAHQPHHHTGQAHVDAAVAAAGGGGVRKRRAAGSDDAARPTKRSRRGSKDPGEGNANAETAVEAATGTETEPQAMQEVGNEDSAVKVAPTLSREEKRKKLESATAVPGATVYLTNLGPGVKQDQVRELAAAHGTVTGVRPLRGYAFVAFASAAEAEAAASKLNGATFHDRKIKAQIAMDRNKVLKEGVPAKPVPLQPGGEKLKPRLVPRAAKRAQAHPVAPRSNADFRALLLGGDKSKSAGK